jgi:hypothetical protein
MNEPCLSLFLVECRPPPINKILSENTAFALTFPSTKEYLDEIREGRSSLSHEHRNTSEPETRTPPWRVYHGQKPGCSQELAGYIAGPGNPIHHSINLEETKHVDQSAWFVSDLLRAWRGHDRPNRPIVIVAQEETLTHLIHYLTPYLAGPMIAQHLNGTVITHLSFKEPHPS